MTKRKVAWIVLALVMKGVVVFTVLAAYTDHQIILTEKRIQERINSKLPITKENAYIKLIIKDVRVNIASKILITMEIEGARWGRALNLVAKTEGVPHYDGQNGSFYFRPSDIEISELKIKGDSVSKNVEKFLDRFVDSPDAQSKKEAVGLKVERWVTNSVQNSAAWALTRIPVYTLPDTLKGNIIRMTIKSVDVVEDVVVIDLSVWQLTKTVALYVALWLLAFVLALGLFMSPGWGTTEDL